MEQPLSNPNFPRFTRTIGIHRRPDGGELHLGAEVPALRLSSDVEKPAIQASMGAAYGLDGFVLEYLANVDGQRDFGELRRLMIEKYGPLFGEIFADQAENWVLSQPGILAVAGSPTANTAQPKVTGTVDGFYPVHGSFEIIETCNFACDHCYYKSSPYKKGRISLTDAVIVMDRLAKNGVRVIELTGGECTIHPEFPEILAHASRTFDLVAIITNGYRIGTNEAIARAVCETPNVAVQVSVDAIGVQHDVFRKHSGAFDAAVKAIERLRASGVVVRMASSITEGTVSHIESLYRLGKSLDVQKITFSAVAPLGRGCNVSEPGAGTTKLMNGMSKALEPFADDPLLNEVQIRHVVPNDSDGVLHGIDDETNDERNCGAGWRTITVDYDGYVRACNFSRDSKRFGNLLADEYSTLFSQQASFFFKNAPSPGGRDCVGCSYRSHCAGCFVKAFMVSETEYPECPWRRKWFPDMSLLEDQSSVSETTRAKQERLPVYTIDDHPMACTSCSGCDCGKTLNQNLDH